MLVALGCVTGPAPATSVDVVKGTRDSGASAGLGTPREVVRVPIEGGSQAVMWGADGETLYVASMHGVLRWAPSSEPEPRTWLQTDTRVEALALDPGGTRLAWTGDTGTAVVDVDSQAELHRFTHDGHSVSLVVGPRHMVAIDRRNTLRTYDHVAGKRLRTREVDTLHAISVAGTDDGAWVATGGYGSIVLRGTASDVTITMPDCREKTADLACAHWGEHRIEEFGDDGSPPTSYVESSPDWLVHDVVFGPDHKTLAAGRSDGAVLVLDIEEKRVVRRFETDPKGALRVAYSPDGALLAVGGMSGQLDVIRRSDGQIASVRAHQHAIADIAWTRTGLLATASHQGVVVWRVAPGR